MAETSRRRASGAAADAYQQIAAIVAALPARERKKLFSRMADLASECIGVDCVVITEELYAGLGTAILTVSEIDTVQHREMMRRDDKLRQLATETLPALRQKVEARRTARTKHAQWREWREHKGLSDAKIARLWEKQTGEPTTEDAVRKARRRWERSTKT